MKLMIFDTETTGLPPKSLTASKQNVHLFPHLIQLGYQIFNDDVLESEFCSIVLPSTAFDISESAFNAHGISKEKIMKEGKPVIEVMRGFYKALQGIDLVICHNLWFDSMLINCEFLRIGYPSPLLKTNNFCTMEHTTNILKLPSPYRGKFKFPKLVELHNYLFGENFEGAHDALNDVKATAKCYFEMKRIGLIE